MPIPTVVANPVLRNRALAHVTLTTPDGLRRYETIAIDRAGEPCDLLSGARLRGNVYRNERSQAHATAVLEAFDRGDYSVTPRKAD